ncbi:MAG: hypothetical protein QM687_03455 [Ferruginibacter sp.]
MQTTFGLSKTIFAAVMFAAALYGGDGKAQSIHGPEENTLVLPAKAHTVPLRWQGDSINGKWEPHTALLIPVKLANCPRQFYMQFDLGHPYTVFYKNKLQSIRQKYPKAVQVDESTEKLLNFSFRAGKMPVSAEEIAVKQYDSSVIDWKDKHGIEIIGTIGVDFIDGRTAIIDYPGQKMTIAAEIPPKLLSRVTLTDFFYAKRRVLLPAKIMDKQTMLYFDTGSSMYELLTDKKSCEALAIPGSAFVQSSMWSWNKYLTANSIPSNGTIEINGARIPVHYATYIEGVNSAQVEQMMKMGIGGMTGNKIFLEYQLVLDTKNKQFGLIRGGK